MKKIILVCFTLALLALAFFVSYLLLTKDTLLPEADKDKQDKNETAPFNFTKDKQRPHAKRVASSPYDPPYWLFFFKHRIPCTEDKLPLPSGYDACPGDWIDQDPGNILDFDEWITSDTQWKTAASKISTFSLGPSELQWYFEQGLEEGKTAFLDGLEDIMRRGYLNVQFYFSQHERSSAFQFDPNMRECCYSAYSKHYLDATPPLFSARDLLKTLKQFMRERGIPEDRVNFFLDIYDVVGGTKVKTLRNTPPEHYAREVMKHILAIQDIIPATVYVHEHSIWKEPYDPIPDDQRPLSGQQIKGQIRALAKEAQAYNAPVGVMIDAVMSDPRSNTDACKKELLEQYPEDDGLDGMQQLIPVAREAGIPVGVFLHPYQDVRREKNDPCNFPSNEEDAYDSYMASARAIADVSLNPDFFVFASWTHYPNYALPETQPYTVTNMLLDVVQTIKGK